MTVAGTRALAGLLLARVTTTPLCGAGPFRKAVPVVVRPPITVGDFNVSDESAILTGLTVITAVLVTPEYVALMFPEVAAPTGTLVTGKLPSSPVPERLRQMELPLRDLRSRARSRFLPRVPAQSNRRSP